MHQLRRIAHGFARNGFHAHLKYRLGGIRGKHHPIAQLRKERKPERVILPHIQHARNADRAFRCLLRRQRLIIEQPVPFVFVKVRRGVLNFLLAQPALAAVARNKTPSAAEMVDCQQAVVCTALTTRHRGFYFQRIHFLSANKRRLIARGIFVPRDKPRAERTHNARDIRTDSLPPANHLKAFQHRVIIKRTTLHDHGFPHRFRVRNFNHLQQGVFDNGIRQPCGNIRHVRAFLLRLLYAGIHEYRTTGTKVNRVFGKKRDFRKIRYCIIQRFRKCFNKRAAAGGTRFVQQHAVDYVILDTDALHILPADVQNKINIRLEELCRLVVCHCFDIS